MLITVDRYVKKKCIFKKISRRTNKTLKGTQLKHVQVQLPKIQGSI